MIAVPEQLATSRLAGMPPITGFYAFIAGTVLFALLGSNPQMSVGADSTIAPLFAVGVAHLATVGSARYVELVAILAVMAGVIVALVWLLRLGWIAEFLSAPIIVGFLAGVAVIIVVHQLPDLLGLEPVGGSTAHRLAASSPTSATSTAGRWRSGSACSPRSSRAERVDRRLPGALVGLVAATVAGRGRGPAGARRRGARHGRARRAAIWAVGRCRWSGLGSSRRSRRSSRSSSSRQSAATTRAFAAEGGYERRRRPRPPRRRRRQHRSRG